jgi:bifunctional non-homologous end joining protein LigD
MTTVERYKPMRPTKALEVPVGPDWLYEVKFNGWRVIAYINGGEVKLISKGGHDYTKKFKLVAEELPQVFKAKSCVVDGEIIHSDWDGYHDLSERLQQNGVKLYYIFDLLELNGQSLIERPLIKRLQLLKKIFRPRRPPAKGICGGPVMLSETFTDGPALLEQVHDRKLEGIVAKKKDSLYLPGEESRKWLKIKK